MTSRLWYLVAAALPAVALAAVLLATDLLRGGTIDQLMPINQPVAVSMDPSQERMVWARDDGTPKAEVACTFGADARTAQTGTRRILDGQDGPADLDVDGVHWRGVLTLSASPAGTYQVTCTPTTSGDAPILSVGEAPRFLDARSQFLVTLTTIAVTTVGLLAGTLIVVFVAIRRSAQEAATGA